MIATLVGWLAIAAHRLQRWRLRVERLRPERRPRILATACWDFPIYSQTFVYQELTQLARQGFRIRFIYSKLNAKANLPPQFSPVWRARRRMVLHPRVCEWARQDIARRLPDRLDRVVEEVARAAGSTPEAVRAHRHFHHALVFTSLVEAARPDYLHSYFFYEGSLFALVAGELLGIPRGVSCYADHMLDDYELKLVRLHLQQCAIAVATSDRIRGELMALAPDADHDRIIVKPNGINAERFRPVTRAAPGEQLRLTSVCRIDPKKGLPYLLDAARLLRDRGRRVEVDLVGGEDGSPASATHAAALRRRHAELALDGVVHFHGRKNEREVRGLLARSDIHVAPFIETEDGDKDGIPTSLLEAMASGLPVIATDAGSIREVITHDVDGILVPQRDAVAIADAVERLAADAALRTALGQRAAATVRERFDVTRCEHVFHERLRETLRPGGGR